MGFKKSSYKHGLALPEALLMIVLMIGSVVGITWIIIRATNSAKEAEPRFRLVDANNKEQLVLYVGEYIETTSKTGDEKVGRTGAGVWRVESICKGGEYAVIVRGLRNARFDEDFKAEIMRLSKGDLNDGMITFGITTKQIEADLNFFGNMKFYKKGNYWFDAIDKSFKTWDEKLATPQTAPLKDDKENLEKPPT